MQELSTFEGHSMLKTGEAGPRDQSLWRNSTLGAFYWRLVSERDVREAARQPEVESCEGEQPFREAADEASFLILF